MNLFVAILSFFCLYLLHCAEAKAAPLYSGDQYVQHNKTDQGIDATPAIHSQQNQNKTEINKWIPWPFIGSESVGFVPSPSKSNGRANLLTSIATKEFVIRTGLSPPL